MTTEPVRSAVVVGTGAMGPEIAAALLDAGVSTRLAGRTLERARAAADVAGELSGRPVPRASSIDDAPFDAVDLVVETISEDAGLKRDLFERNEPRCSSRCLIVTNTSSLRIEDLATALTRPARFAGLHFLKPAHLTGVVEIIPGPATEPATVARLEGLSAGLGKMPLRVRADVPGFIWNRIQFAVLRECLHMVEAGVATAADVDAAVADGLAPRWLAAGPLATADLGGLRTVTTICDQLFPHLATEATAPELLRQRAAADEPLQPWVRAAGVDIARLRADALRSGAAFTGRRRAMEGPR
ncbi:MAG: 3-hydroxyacyl-CoA dehydrogenase NAD-binding domain-containing protein [Thermoleophilia bacterium]